MYITVNGKREKVKTLTMVVKKFIKDGSTYHRSDLYLNNKHVHQTKIHYGYGNHFKTTIIEDLKETNRKLYKKMLLLTLDNYNLHHTRFNDLNIRSLFIEQDVKKSDLKD